MTLWSTTHPNGTHNHRIQSLGCQLQASALCLGLSDCEANNPQASNAQELRCKCRPSPVIKPLQLGSTSNGCTIGSSLLVLYAWTSSNANSNVCMFLETPFAGWPMGGECAIRLGVSHNQNLVWPTHCQTIQHHPCEHHPCHIWLLLSSSLCFFHF